MGSSQPSQGGVTKPGLCPFSEVYDFQILLRVPCLWFRHSSALTLILAFTSRCPGGEVKLEVWKCSPEAPDQFSRSVHEPGAAQGGTGCPEGFCLPGKELQELWGPRECKRRAFASEMSGFEAGGTPWIEPTHSRLVTLHNGTEPGCDRWCPWI